MSGLIRKFASIESSSKLGARQVRIVASDGTVDRVGDIMVASGCDIAGYKDNPIVLADHNPVFPIGNAKVDIVGGRVEALITFAPEGISEKADEYCGLTKAGVLNAASVGFEPVEWDPLPGGGRKYTDWRLMEISIVAVPANPAATVIERSARASRSRPGSHILRASSRIILPKHLCTNDSRCKCSACEWTRPGERAWLRRQWPGLSTLEARKADWQRIRAMPLDQRIAERERKNKFRLEFETKAIQPLSYEERQRDLVRLAPKRGPWSWDPNKDAATNMYEKTIWDQCGGRWPNE